MKKLHAISFTLLGVSSIVFSFVAFAKIFLMPNAVAANFMQFFFVLLFGLGSFFIIFAFAKWTDNE